MEKFFPVTQEISPAETIVGGKFVYIALFRIVCLQIRGYIQDFFVNFIQLGLFCRPT